MYFFKYTRKRAFLFGLVLTLLTLGAVCLYFSGKHDKVLTGLSSCDPLTETQVIEQRHQLYLRTIVTQAPPIRLELILQDLNENMSKFEFGYQHPEFLVVPNKELESKQVGNNTVLVSSRFLEPGLFTDDELTAMLAHEVYHKVHRDIERGACLTGLKLSALQKQSELEADKSAQEYLVRNNLDPRALISLLTKISEQSPQTLHSESSTHPAMGKRIAALKKLIP